MVDWGPAGPEDRLTDLAVRSLQGLVNRERPCVWVGAERGRPGDAGFWLDELVRQGLAEPGYEILSAREFLQRFRGYASGLVIPPLELGSDAYHVAVAKAAVEGAIVGGPELAEELALPVVADFRGVFPSRAAAFRWTLERLLGTGALSHEAVCHLRDDLGSATAMVDLAVARRLFTFSWREGDGEELAVLEEALYLLPDCIPVLGAVGGGRGYASEGDLVGLVSAYGKYLIGCSGCPNLSLALGYEPVEPEECRQRWLATSREEPDRDAIYVTVQISDGDNMNVWRYHLLRRGLWGRRGRVPLGWTMAPALREMLPYVARYYLEEEPPSAVDEFIQGVSGVGYMFPGEFARGAYRVGEAFSPERREAAWSRFMELTRAHLVACDHAVATTVHYDRFDGCVGPGELARYARGLPVLGAVLNGYNAVNEEYGAPWMIVDGLPVIHTSIDRQWGCDLKVEILENAGEHYPAFVQVFWIPMKVHIDWALEELASLPRGIEVVTPSEFARLFRRAHGLPLAGGVGGVVTDARGMPVAGARVVATPGGFCAETDPEGRFRMAGLPEGRYTVHAQTPAGRSADVAVTVSCGRYALAQLVVGPVGFDSSAAPD